MDWEVCQTVRRKLVSDLSISLALSEACFFLPCSVGAELAKRIK